MTKSYTIGGLNRFIRNFPRARVCIGEDMDGVTINQYIPGAVGYVIASYSRVRDARRALNKLGYVQEGVSWKPPMRPAWPFAVDSKETSNVQSD